MGADISIKQKGYNETNDLEFNIIRGTSNVIMHARKRSYYKTIRGVAIPPEKKRGPHALPSSCDTDLSHYRDYIDIPGMFIHKGRTYTVVAMDPELMLQGIAVFGVTIPGTIEAISEFAFFHCINMDRAIMNEGTKMICQYAFSGCPNLHDIVIPNSVLQIENNAFYFCQNLTTVTLGENLKLMGANAFDNSPNITKVICRAAEPPTLFNPGNTFHVSIFNRAELLVPSGSETKYMNAPGWGLFGNISCI